jgi:hypothetical protein
MKESSSDILKTCLFFFFFIATSYQSVSKALDILKRQLIKATNDVKVLDTLKSEAMNDPYSFIADLKKVKKNQVCKLDKTKQYTNVFVC